MCYDLSSLDQKVFSYIVSKLDPYHPQDEYEIDIKEYMEIVGIDSTSGRNYENVKKSLKSLSDKSVWVDIFEDGKKGVKLARVLNDVKVFEQSGIVKFRIGDLVSPYLFDLNHFIKYSLLYILGFKRRYSIHLYEILKSYQYLGAVDVPLEDLKECLLRGKNGVKPGYAKYKDFNRRVLAPCIEEINELSDITVEYKAKSLGKGKTYDTITFVIHGKSSNELVSTWVQIDDIINKSISVGQTPGQISLFDYVEQPKNVGEGEVQEGYFEKRNKTKSIESISE